VADPAEALARLDEITRRLRRECPWDREQDERSIVPHTVEEAYELADAAHSGDDAKLLDELGDVLFQVYFLSLLLEERGAGSLAEVAEAIRTKLVRRHPHVFGEREAADADAVRRNWDEIKRDEEGGARDPFSGIPDTLPATLYAKKALRRAGGHVPGGRAAEGEFETRGDELLEAVRRAAEAGVDPELALRAAAERFAAGAGRGSAPTGPD
jgi:XTP/dITP diphosphohydrolase/tetrapyrrole methylase family protein/MazG family protein/ATP diphosphatase